LESPLAWNHALNLEGGDSCVAIFWIIIIIVLVLLVLGFFSRGRW